MHTLTLPQSVGSEEPHFLERLRRAELDAIGEVYDRHHPALCAFAQRLLADDQAAEDLVHDVFVLLPKVIHKFDGGSLRSFLLGIAANRARHHVRAAARRRKMAERLAVVPQPTPESPEQHAERRCLARALARALDVLSVEHRVTFVLCEIEGRSAAEAAKISGVPEATVRTRLFYAKQKLRAHLARRGMP
jgi:RNA polymerase sigma-70 factor, ECF subfamily